MDAFTNYMVTGVLTILVWVIGAIWLKINKADSLDYITWLKIWALTVIVQSIIFSLLLGVIFPDPTIQEITTDLNDELNILK